MNMARNQPGKIVSKDSSSKVIAKTPLSSLKNITLYKCEHCNYTCDKKCLLTRHQVVHSRDKPYCCSRCDARFTQSGSLRRHFMNAHSVEEVFGFSIAKDNVKADESLRTAIKLSESPETFIQLSDLMIDPSILNLEKQYICTECDERFTQFGSLKRHRLRAHAIKKGFKCCVCAYAGATNSDLKSHMLVHAGEKLFQCSECGAAFTVPSRLRKHQIRVHGEKKHLKCPSCDYTCSFPSTLKTHQLVHTKRKTHKCSDCGKWFLRLSHLKRHQLTTHSDSYVVCDYCNYSCSIKEQLLAHIKLNHTGVKSFKCDKCKAAFITQYHLKRHNLIVHVKEKRFVCSVCGYQCYYKSELEKHEFTHHDFKLVFSDDPSVRNQNKEENIFKCLLCDLTLDSKLKLDLHLLNHTGGAPFSCSVCGSSFRVEGSLKRHTDRLHSDDK